MPDPLPGELWLPPAKQGDLLEAAMKYRPRQIVLIDGCFHQVLSTWVKEIVWALTEGIVVIGASSMGALRAADCDRHGMIGVGEIYRRYATGETEDDSEVILNYDPETNRPLSVPKVGHEQKRRDALEAIALARGDTAKCETDLDKEAITPYLDIVVKRILEDTHS